jgi:hypothetical protein
MILGPKMPMLIPLPVTDPFSVTSNNEDSAAKPLLPVLLVVADGFGGSW